MTRLFGHLLTWRQDTTADVYLVMTANNVKGVPYEMFRPGRFDATFFADTPGEAEREAIWAYHTKKYDVNETTYPRSEEWTGAEIEHCCMLAAQLGYSLQDAADITPAVVKRAPQTLKEVRDYASGWALNCNEEGIYTGSKLDFLNFGQPKRRKTTPVNQNKVNETL